QEGSRTRARPIVPRTGWPPLSASWLPPDTHGCPARACTARDPHLLAAARRAPPLATRRGAVAPTIRGAGSAPGTASWASVRAGSRCPARRWAATARSAARSMHHSWPAGLGEQDAERGEHAARVLAVHRHAEPVRGFFRVHRLDALRHLAHVLAAAHGCEHAEQQ